MEHDAHLTSGEQVSAGCMTDGKDLSLRVHIIGTGLCGRCFLVQFRIQTASDNYKDCK